MFDRLLDILFNSHFEAWVVGPVLGAVLGTLFTSIGKRPHDGQRDQTPAEVRQHVCLAYQAVREREIHHHHYHASPARRDSDGSPIFVIVGVLGMLVLFLFTAYLPRISQALLFVITGVATFSLSVAITAIAGGQFNTRPWWMHAIGPVAASLACFWIVLMAERAIGPEVVRFAQGLIASQPNTVAGFSTAAFAFFRNLNGPYVQWMIFVMLAFGLVAMVAIASALQCVHYVALAKLRDGGGGVWERTVLATQRFARMRAQLGSWFFLALAWPLAAGHVWRLLN